MILMCIVTQPNCVRNKTLKDVFLKDDRKIMNDKSERCRCFYPGLDHFLITAWKIKVKNLFFMS